MWTANPRSVFASAQSEQRLQCPLTESSDTTECMKGEQNPGLDFVYAQGDLILRILHMFEGHFSLDAAQL